MSLPVIKNNESSDAVKPAGQPKIARIEVDRDLCIGAESCAVVSPEAFYMDETNIAVVQENALDAPQDQIWEAAQVCPVAAVLLFDESGNQVYP